MKKRLISILMIVVLLTVSFSLPSFAATAMKLTGATYPTVLKKGAPFVARGIITSDCDILEVVIGVYNSSGRAEFEYIGLPGEKSYDINNVDYLLSFSKLPTGTFTYKIVATDEKSSKVVLLNRSFAVNTTGKVSTIKLTDGTYPANFTQGEGYSVKGVISSNYNLTEVVIGAYNTNGTVGFEFSDTPYTKSFDIRDVDYSLPFSKLKAGTYMYKIVASDTNSSNVVLMQKTFNVTTSGTSASSLKLNNATYPSNVNYGEGYSVKGTVTSDCNITKVVIGAYTSSGAKGFEYVGYPNSKSFDISDVDYYLTFSKLSVGTYTYKIMASDSRQSNVVLAEKTFRVISGGSSTGDLNEVNWDVIDISYWNRNAIDSWSDMASELDAIILRLGFAYTASKKMEEDDSFADYYAAAKRNSIPVGIYYFGAATTVSEAEKEADFVLDLLDKYDCKLEMPVYYDLETEDQVDLTQEECTAVARTFCDKVSAAGYYVGIYCNKYFARDELYASQLSDFDFWIAEYNSSCTYSGEYGMWQYTESGRISGLNGVCDKNYCYYDYPTYIKANGLNGFSKPQPAANPQFGFKTGANLTVNQNSKTVVLKKSPGLTQSQFISKYVSYKDVNVGMSALVGGKVATGSKISAAGNGKSFGPYTICLLGDTSSDSKINSNDALLILQHSVGSKKLSGYPLISADWNGDGKVNSLDALEVLKFSVSQ